MSDTIAIEADGFKTEYAALWAKHDANSFFRSPAHLDMITALTAGELAFAVCRRDGVPFAALPFVTKRTSLGAVINSLPFFGTCSCVVGAADSELSMRLSGALLDHARVDGVSAVTVIDDWRTPSFQTMQAVDYVTTRTNQFIDLRTLVGRNPIDTYHQKTRNLVRKAEKLSVSCRVSSNVRDIDGLEAAHRENMARVNGVAKPAAFFNLLRNASHPLGRHALFVASVAGSDCAYLLNFYCGDTVEYYMPAILVDARSSQPLSLLVDRAISDAVRDGYAFWNFGGTWSTQGTLRHFKIRWGSSESTYSYYTHILDRTIATHGREALTAAFPYFFVVPFDMIVPPNQIHEKAS